MVNEPASYVQKRKDKRKTLHGNAYLLLPDRQPLVVRMLDVSAGGVGIISPINLPSATVCTIRFGVPVELGEKTSVELEVKVTHSVFSSGVTMIKNGPLGNSTTHRSRGMDGFKIGLQFTGLSATVAPTIFQFLSKD